MTEKKKLSVNEIASAIAKEFKAEELLKIGNRSYLNTFKHFYDDPERFDIGDHLFPNRGSFVSLRAKERLVDVEPPSWLVFPYGDRIFRKSGLPETAGKLESGTDFSTVINDVKGNDRLVFVKAGSYSQTSTLTFTDLDSFSLVHELGVIITLGSGVIGIDVDGGYLCTFDLGELYRTTAHTDPFIRVRDTTAKQNYLHLKVRNLISGSGSLNKGIYFKSEATGIVGCHLFPSRIYRCDRSLTLETIGTGWINGNVFDNYVIGSPVVGVEFIKGGGAISTNTFRDILVQADAVITTHGYKDIDSIRNAFFNCKAWDFSGTQITANIKSTAADTLIWGGIMTDVNFEDLGARTVISDQWTKQIPGFFVSIPIMTYTYTKTDPGTSYVDVGTQYKTVIPFNLMQKVNKARMRFSGSGNEAGSGKGVRIYNETDGEVVCEYTWDGIGSQNVTTSWVTYGKNKTAEKIFVVQCKGSSATEDITHWRVELQLMYQ